MMKTKFTLIHKYLVNCFAIALVLIGVQDLNAQCSLACHGTTNVSLDMNCEAEIELSMVADTSGCLGGSFEITLNDASGNPIIGNMVGNAHVNTVIEVVVTDVNSNNSCWGNILVEDKLPPSITCPQPAEIYCFELDDITPTATDNCDPDPEVILLNEIVDVNDCGPGTDDEVIKTVTRVYQAEDNQGMLSGTCTITVDVLRVDDLDDIDEPQNFLLADNTELQCDGGYATLPNGHPAPIAIVDGGTGSPSLDGVALYPSPYTDCNILVTFTDTELPKIGCAEKIMRMWNVVEWSCSNPQRTYEFVQMIEIVDSEGPEITCPADFSSSTNTYDCEAAVLFPPADVTDNCSATTTVDIAYPGGFIMDTNGGLGELPIGDHVVTYTAYDECLNSNSCTVNVSVADNTPPVAICDQFTVVALTSDGYAWVQAEVFDDGSYDECGDVTRTVRRMDDGDPCNNVDDDIFDGYVRFCCADLGTPVVVVFRVTDESGNVNDCMVNVEVQDKLAPTIACPADMEVDCDFPYDLNNPGAFFGEPTVEDNCGNTMPTFTIANNLNQCNIGDLRITYSVTDGSGIISTCTQDIFFDPIDPFNVNNDDIDWPEDVDMEGCADPTNPLFHPDNTGYPTWIEGPCDLVGANWNDEVFLFNNTQGDACFKIIRTWSVIDWCTYNGNFATSSAQPWTWVQIIKVNDPEGPEITSDCSRKNVCTFDANCAAGFIELTAAATDNCTDVLTWTYQIDANNDGSFDAGLGGTGVGNTIDASGEYPVGNHRILYTFQDRCGNTTSCEQLFDIVNCKAPTPYCLNGLAVDLMPMDTDGDGTIDNGMVELWATDFDNGSSHPCGYEVYISFDPVFFSPTGNTELPDGRRIEVNNNRTFTCADFGEVSVDIYAAVVTPEDTIIQAYCTTFVDIQDNMGACDIMRVGVAGNIATENNVNVEDVIVDLLNSEMDAEMTDDSGMYVFPSMDIGGQYTVQATKNDDVTNGVSTIDIVKIQRHILGLEALDSPYKIIAADANNDGKLTATDLIQIRKVVLGSATEFTNNTSWRFIDSEYTFVDPIDPFSSDIPEVYEIQDLTSNMNVNFVAVKVADVNSSAEANLQEGGTTVRSGNAAMFTTDNVSYASNETVTAAINSKEATTTYGMQFTVEFDASTLTFEGIVSDKFDVEGANVNTEFAAKGFVSVSINAVNAVELDEEETVFELTFNARANGNLDNVSFTSKATTAEFYNADFTISNIELEVENREITTETAFVLNTNRPNPFSEQTMISFEIPTAEQGTLRIMDVTGKLIYNRTENFVKGYNEIIIDGAELDATGILYYQINAGQYAATSKMVKIK